MSWWLYIVAVVISALLLVPTVVIALETLLALIPLRKRKHKERPACKRVILIPAHNEEMVLATTLNQIKPQLHNGDRIVVLADNCSDATANVARDCGVHVLERNDTQRRGKGYALDFGLQALKDDAPDIVLIFDADARLADNAVDALTAQVLETRSPAQAVYLLHSDDAKRGRIRDLAFLVKNQVRALGLRRAGIPCLLAGNGMAFPYHAICSVDLATGHITEDIRLGIDLALAGHMSMLCPDARVHGRFPTNSTAWQQQRSRWEHGHLSLLVSQTPRLLWAALTRGSYRLLGLALELAVPALSLLLLLLLMMHAAGWGLVLVGMGYVPVILTGIGFGMLAFTALAAKFAFAPHFPLGRLFLAPCYAVAKLPLYFKFLFNREKRWVRTERTAEDALLGGYTGESKPADATEPSNTDAASIANPSGDTQSTPDKLPATTSIDQPRR